MLRSSDITERTFIKPLGKHVLTHLKNVHLFLTICAELISEFRNAPES